MYHSFLFLFRFGNLVTMEWWSHLWLNEAFATWANYFATDALEPSFEIWTQFLHSDLADALSLDGLASSHPIEVAVQHPEDIDEVFDAISYSKGCAVIRMLIQFLGEERFRKGLCAYLRSNLYSNAKSDDLWRHLEAASGEPVEQLMEGWTKRVGYPLLTVTGTGADLTAKQTRFLSDGSTCAASADTLWIVPALVTDVASGAEAKALLRQTVSAVPVPAGAAAEPLVLLNLDRAGCFRVNYPAATWDRIIAALRAGAPALKDNVAARLTLASDGFALARAGLLEPKIYLSLLLALMETEDSYHVWSELSSNVGSLLAALRPHPAAASALKAALRTRVAAFTKRTAWAAEADSLWGTADAAADGSDSAEDEEGAHLVSLFRQALVSVIEDLELPSAAAEATARVAAFFAGKGHVDADASAGKLLNPDVRGAAFRLSASSGGTAAREALYAAFTECPLAEEKDRLAGAFAAVRSDADADAVLNTLLAGFSSAAGAIAKGELTALKPGEPLVRSQDVAFVLRQFAGNAAQLPRAWAFVKKHWDSVIYPEYNGSSALRHAIALANGFASDEMARDVEAFFAAHPHRGAEKFVEQCAERIRTNAKFGDALAASGACELLE